jgi:hypothetical protein
MDRLERWCRITIVGPDGTVVASGVLEGSGAPDLGTVDDVARQALLAARLGGDIVLDDVSPALRALLDLAGLGVEVEGKAECGEEPLGVQEVQEEIHPRDLPF